MHHLRGHITHAVMHGANHGGHPPTTPGNLGAGEILLNLTLLLPLWFFQFLAAILPALWLFEIHQWILCFIFSTIASVFLVLLAINLTAILSILTTLVLMHGKKP